jgi:sec-independent protein translocase protein TatB
MFDVSFWEFFLVFVLALLVLGPERLPRAAHTAGLWLGRAKNAMRRLQREVQREFLIEETRQATKKAREAGSKLTDAQSPDTSSGDS